MKFDVRSAPPGRTKVPGEQGLYLYVSPNGVRRWIFRYSRPNGAGVTETGLGCFPEVSFSRARAEAGGCRTPLLNGADPVESKRGRPQQPFLTFAEAGNAFIARLKGNWSESQIHNANLLIHQHGKAMSGKPVKAITTKAVDDAIAPLMSKTPLQGYRALAMWERVFDFAATEVGKFENPARWKGNLEYRFPRKRKNGQTNYAAMPYRLIPAFMPELRKRQLRSMSAVAMEVLILTAVRTSELLGMQWSEIDIANKLWVIPAERMKADKEHRVPLSDRVLALLARRKEHAPGPNVFTGYSNEPLNNKALRFELYAMGYRNRVTVHGFRSAFRNWCAEQKHDFAASEMCLAHGVGTKVTRSYLRTDMLEERRAIMDQWAKYYG
jgi:integrase